MSISMSTGSYEVEHDSMEAEYGLEIMCSGWNPAVDLVPQQQLVPMEKQLNIPASLTSAVAELFLDEIYTYQR